MVGAKWSGEAQARCRALNVSLFDAIGGGNETLEGCELALRSANAQTRAREGMHMDDRKAQTLRTGLQAMETNFRLSMKCTPDTSASRRREA